MFLWRAPARARRGLPCLRTTRATADQLHLGFGAEARARARLGRVHPAHHSAMARFGPKRGTCGATLTGESDGGVSGDHFEKPDLPVPRHGCTPVLGPCMTPSRNGTQSAQIRVGSGAPESGAPTKPNATCSSKRWTILSMGLELRFRASGRRRPNRYRQLESTSQRMTMAVQKAEGAKFVPMPKLSETESVQIENVRRELPNMKWHLSGRLTSQALSGESVPRRRIWVRRQKSNLSGNPPPASVTITEFEPLTLIP